MQINFLVDLILYWVESNQQIYDLSLFVLKVGFYFFSQITIERSNHREFDLLKIANDEIEVNFGYDIINFVFCVFLSNLFSDNLF